MSLPAIWKALCLLWKLPLAVLSFVLGLWFAWRMAAKDRERIRWAARGRGQLFREISALRKRLRRTQGTNGSPSSQESDSDLVLEPLAEAAPVVTTPRKVGPTFPLSDGKNWHTPVKLESGIESKDPVRSKDDLTLIEGIDEILSQALNEEGVYQYADIAHLSEAQVTAFENKGGAWKRVPWSYWQSYFAEHDTPPEIPETFEGEDVAVSPDLGIVFKSAPKEADDFGMIAGIGTPEVEAMKNLGIYQFQQIASLNDEQLGHFEEKAPALGEIDWHFWRARFQKEEGVPELPAAMQWSSLLGPIYANKPSAIDAFEKLEGMEAGSVAALHHVGIYQFSQVGAMNDEQLGKLSELPELAKVDWAYWREWFQCGKKLPEIPKALSSQEVKCSPKFGYLYTKPPEERDDFTRLEGVNEAAANALSSLGIYQNAQLASMEESQLMALEKEVPCALAKWRPFFQAHAKMPAVPEGMHGEKVAWSLRFDGYRYQKVPRHTDDFQKLEGVTPKASKTLNKEGVYQYRQIAVLTERQLDHLSEASPELGSVDWARWRAYFQKYGTTLAVPKAFAGEKVCHSADLGLVYPVAPANADDFTKLEGIDTDKVSVLHRLGVYRFQQVAHWSEEQIQWLEKKEPSMQGIPWLYWRDRFRRDEGQLIISRVFDSAAKLQISPDFGVIYQAKPSAPETWMPLEGMTTEAQSTLWNHGLYQYKQLAQLPERGLAILAREVPQVDWVYWQRHFRATEGELVLPAHLETDALEVTKDGAYLYRERPIQVDDLSLLEESDSETEKRLNALGIYQFNQITHVNERSLAQWESKAPALRALPWQNWQRLIHARGATLTPYLRIHRGIPLEHCEESFLSYDAALGPIYKERPNEADDLRFFTNDDAEAARGLNACGIFRYWQLATMSDQQFAALAKRDHRFAALNKSVGQSRPGLSSGGELRPFLGDRWRWERWRHRELDLPLVKDDFTELAGVDARLAKSLNQLGLVSFIQLANLSKQEIRSLQEGASDAAVKAIDWQRLRWLASRALGKAPVIPAPGIGSYQRWSRWVQAFEPSFLQKFWKRLEKVCKGS